MYLIRQSPPEGYVLGGIPLGCTLLNISSSISVSCFIALAINISIEINYLSISAQGLPQNVGFNQEYVLPARQIP